MERAARATPGHEPFLKYKVSRLRSRRVGST